MQPDDQDLVRQAMRGDRDAYSSLYDRYANLVRAICFDSTGNLEHAQDTAQEVFLRAYQKLPSLRNVDQFGSWLIGIARNVCREWLKRQRRDRRVRSGIPSEALAVEANSDAECEQKIHWALAQLPERQRMALHLFYLQGKSVSEARQILELSPSGFYKLLDQASERITKVLETGE
jgi:RNA polymerase sigma-70 factor (ECF subfamily)